MALHIFMQLIVCGMSLWGGLLVVGWIDVYRVDLNRFKLNKKNINNFN